MVGSGTGSVYPFALRSGIEIATNAVATAARRA